MLILVIHGIPSNIADEELNVLKDDLRRSLYRFLDNPQYTIPEVAIFLPQDSIRSVDKQGEYLFCAGENMPEESMEINMAIGSIVFPILRAFAKRSIGERCKKVIVSIGGRDPTSHSHIYGNVA